MVSAMMRNCGAAVHSYGIVRDDVQLLRQTVAQAVAENEMVLLSGGSSVGMKDATCQVISELGELLLHEMCIRDSPYSVVSVLAKDISAANSMPAGDSNTVMPQTSSTTTGIATPSGSVSPPADNLAPGNNSVTGSSATGGTAGQGGANQGPETYNDALKNEQQRGIYTSPSGSSEFFPGGSTPPNLELPIGVEIPPIDEMPTLIITPPDSCV